MPSAPRGHIPTYVLPTGTTFHMSMTSILSNASTPETLNKTMSLVSTLEDPEHRRVATPQLLSPVPIEVVRRRAIAGNTKFPIETDTTHNGYVLRMFQSISEVTISQLKYLVQPVAECSCNWATVVFVFGTSSRAVPSSHNSKVRTSCMGHQRISAAHLCRLLKRERLRSEEARRQGSTQQQRKRVETPKQQRGTLTKSSRLSKRKDSKVSSPHPMAPLSSASSTRREDQLVNFALDPNKARLPVTRVVTHDFPNVLAMANM